MASKTRTVPDWPVIFADASYAALGNEELAARLRVECPEFEELRRQDVWYARKKAGLKSPAGHGGARKGAGTKAGGARKKGKLRDWSFLLRPKWQAMTNSEAAAELGCSHTGVRKARARVMAAHQAALEGG